MATTYVPNPRLPRRKINLAKTLADIHRMRKMAQGDEDKAGDIDDASYYEGWGNALTWVEHLMTRADKHYR